MFKLPFRTYYYGDGTSNVLLLHDKMAAAVNKLRLFDVVEIRPGVMYATINLNDDERGWYHAATIVLNKYLETHTVMYDDTDQDILRPVK